MHSGVSLSPQISEYLSAPPLPLVSTSPLSTDLNSEQLSHACVSLVTAVRFLLLPVKLLMPLESLYTFIKAR